MSRFSHFYDFLYYVRQTRVLVGHAFGVTSTPSGAMETIPGWTPKEYALLHISLPDDTNRVYYDAYTACLDDVIRHLEMIEYRPADSAQTSQESQELQKHHEQTVISLYEPLLSHIHGVLQKDVNLLGLFEAYYANLEEYELAYVARYKATLKELVGALMSLRDANADEYYRVIHEFSMQEYYGILNGLEKESRLTRFRAALDAAAVNGNMVDVAAAYSSYLELGVRPTYLTYLLRDVARVQRLVALAESADKKN